MSSPASDQEGSQRKPAAVVFRQWMQDRGIELDGPPSVLIVLLHLLERAAGTWKPAASQAVGGLKHGSVRQIPSAVINDFAAEGHDVSHLISSDDFSVLVANLKDRLPLEQVATKRAMPLTDERMDTIVGHLRSLVESCVAHPLWALRWIAMIHLARAAGLRPAEAVRLRAQWIKRIRTAAGPAFRITIPYSKYQPEPKTVIISPALPNGAVTVSLLDEWLNKAQKAGHRFEGRALVFPLVRPDTPPRPPRTESVAGLVLANFPHLVDELDEDIDPSQLPAGANRSVQWRCTRGHIWIQRVDTRTLGAAICPDCSQRRRSAVPLPDEPIRFLNPIEERFADPEFEPEGSRSSRMTRAIELAAQEFGASFKAICEASGLSPRDVFEGLSANGPRRGIAVESSKAGIRRETTSGHLRHSHPDVSNPYIDERDLHPPSALSDLPGWNE